MKKLLFMSAAAVAILCSCGGGSPKANLKTDIDSLSYEIGLAQSNGVKEYLSQRMGIDTAYLDEFIKGLNDGAQAGDDKRKAAYYAGVDIGQRLSTQYMKGINYEIYGEDSTKTISLKNMLAGFIAGTRGKGIMSLDEAYKRSQETITRLKNVEMEKSFGVNKTAGEKFMAENAKKAGIKTLAGGVQYKVIKEGNGPIPADTSKVQVSYEGRLVDGTVFDSSYKNNNGQPIHTRANEVIKGWTEALTHMPAGSVWEIYIPQDMAYGNRQLGQIKPFSALIFKLELVKVGE